MRNIYEYISLKKLVIHQIANITIHRKIEEKKKNPTTLFTTPEIPASEKISCSRCRAKSLYIFATTLHKKILRLKVN